MLLITNLQSRTHPTTPRRHHNIKRTQLADEGLDLPPLRSLIVALSGKSKTRMLQRIGRLARPYPGKDVAIVFDRITPSSSISRRARKKLHENEPTGK